MVNRSLHIIPELALFLLLLLSSGGYWLLQTESGASWLVAQARPFLPPEVQIKTVQGRLLGDFELRELSFRGAQGEFEIERLRLNWQPQALWQQQLRFQQLILDGVTIAPTAHVKTNSHNTPLELPDLEPLFARLGGWKLLLAHFEVNDLRFFTASGKVQRLAQFTTRLELDRSQLQLNKSQIVSDWGHWQADMRLSAESQLILRLENQPGQPLEEIERISTTLSLKPDASHLLRGTLKLELQRKKQPDYQLNGDLSLDPDQLRFSNVQLRRVDGLGGMITGTLGLVWQAQLAWDAQLELAKLNLHPLLDVATDLNGTFSGRGGIQNYSGQFDLNNKAPNWQQLILSGNLTGNTEELVFTQLKGQLLGGQIQGELDLNWRDGLRSDFNLTSQELNLAQLPAGPEGRIDLHLNGWLNKAPEQPLHLGGQAKIDQARVGQHRFAGAISGQWLGGRNLRLDQLDLGGDWGKITARGTLEKRLELHLSLTDATALWPPLQGRGDLSGWLAWTDRWPQGELNANLQQLAYADLKIAQLRVSARRQKAQTENLLHVQLSQLEIGDYPLQELTLDLRGDLSGHQLEAQARHLGRQLKLTLDGALAAEQWQGRVTRLDLLTDAQSDFHLQKPADLHFSRNTFNLAELGLTGEKGGHLELTARGQFPNPAVLSRARTQLSLEKIPLNLFNPWLPSGQTVEGLLGATIDGQLQEDGTISLKGQVDIRDARVSLLDEKNRVEIPIEKLGLNVDWQQNQLQSRLHLKSDSIGSANGQLSLKLPAVWPPASLIDAPLQAKIGFQLPKSGVLALFLPTELAELRGQIDGQVQLAGTLAQPDLSGKLRLMQGQLTLPQLAIDLQPLEIEASLARQTLTINRFLAVSEKAQLRAQGEIMFNAWKPERYHFSLQGDQVLLVNLPEIRARVSPDLVFTDPGSGLLISGRLAIPELAINNWQPALPVSSSTDVVYVDQRPAPQTSIRPYRLELDLELGDRVTVKEKGLDVRLAGKVHLSKTTTGGILARGQIDIPQGHYSAYAVKLPIRSGRLYFSGDAVDNPSLDIQANRKIGEVTAGVNISGTVRRPLIELVSDPTMDDTEILSYIILGRSTTASSGELDMLSLAAGALLSAGDSVSMQQKLKNLGGIDVLSVDNSQAGNLDTTMVTVGKYLNPKLYLSYGHRLTGTASEVQLRYSPSKKIEVETQLGEVSGADLYYKIEFD